MYDIENAGRRRGRAHHPRGHDARIEGHEARPHHPRRHPRGDADGAPFHHRRGGRGRAARGDVRAAVLILLAEEPMHGYQLMRTINDRSGGRWSASPGAVYPTISQLEDEGLVTVTAESGRKLVSLTDAGREHVAEHAPSWADPFAGYAASAPGGDLRSALEQVNSAARQVARTGSDEQITATLALLEQTRRSLYLLLADVPAGEVPTPETSDASAGDGPADGG